MTRKVKKYFDYDEDAYCLVGDSKTIDEIAEKIKESDLPHVVEDVKRENNKICLYAKPWDEYFKAGLLELIDNGIFRVDVSDDEVEIWYKGLPKEDEEYEEETYVDMEKVESLIDEGKYHILDYRVGEITSDYVSEVVIDDYEKIEDFINEIATQLDIEVEKEK